MMSAKELQEFNKNRKITQVCYVTNDYKKTIEYFNKYPLNWGPMDDSEKQSDQRP